jgi:hypothetical protein
MKSWRVQLEVWIERQGLWFIPGLVLLLVAAWAWLAWLPVREAGLQSVLDQVATAARQPATPMPAAPADEVMAQAQDPHQQVQKIFELAAAHGLQIAQAEYRRVEVGGLARLQMQAPMHGSYPQIRHFLRALRVQLPAVTLDELAVRRHENTLEAKLLLSVWHVAPSRKGVP